MSEDHADPLNHPDVQAASTGFYIAAFIVGFGAMALACGLTLGLAMSTSAGLITLGVIGFAAVIVQLCLLFKLGIDPGRVWHTVSVVATMPLLFIAIVLTLWMFDTLAVRTALGGG